MHFHLIYDKNEVIYQFNDKEMIRGYIILILYYFNPIQDKYNIMIFNFKMLNN
jgi:hypothetical protein